MCGWKDDILPSVRTPARARTGSRLPLFNQPILASSRLGYGQAIHAYRMDRRSRCPLLDDPLLSCPIIPIGTEPVVGMTMQYCHKGSRDPITVAEGRVEHGGTQWESLRTGGKCRPRGWYSRFRGLLFGC